MAGLVEGKVALVTGAGSGIGRGSALAFAREGARVVVADLDAETGEQTAAAIRADGGEAAFVGGDVSREDDVRETVRFAIERFGRLDCAHNNAGITGQPAPIQDLGLEAWSQLLAVNLTGVFLCLKHEIALMREQGEGAIVNSSSGAGLVASPGLAHYCASKHGILGLTKTAALENVRTGIRVNAVCPGSIDTPPLRAFMTSSPQAEKMVLSSQPGGRLGMPDEIAEAVVWLCSERASFVTGESLVVDGGALMR
jgi:NAD(P)-dependent dehydrogenase (short-subunit alcohol dehydrogenase family)